MFCHRDKNSVKTLREAIENFGDISGLLPNFSKSTIIFGSMRMEDQHEILDCVPFKVEKLPVKYLGVPLTSKRLSVSNYKSLLDKIKGRFSNWKTKCLSYAGRLQLIASILESIHVYWASVFLLPKTVIRDINKVLKNFLCNQGDISKGKAKVAWKNICKLKTNGGLGLKDLEVWNKCMIIKHLWNIIVDKNTLCVKWVNIVKLKGRSIWAIKEDINDSWGWKNILRLRDEVRQFIVMKDIMEDNICQWLGEWIAKYLVLNLHQIIQIDQRKDDSTVWRSKNGNERNYVCKFSEVLWNKVMNKIEIPTIIRNWKEIVDDFSDMYCGNSINSIIRRLSLDACVYLLWQERNYRIFKNERRTVEDLFNSHNETIRMRLMSLKAKQSQAVISVQKRWNVTMMCPEVQSA
ncbi:hypothetical protein Tco_1404527 [Tanacetum coccineum]